MSSGRGFSSDRMTVIFMVMLCFLFILLISGVIYFLYTTLGPTLSSTLSPSVTLAPAPAVMPSSPGPANYTGNTGDGNVPSPAGEVQLAGPLVYVGELSSGTVRVLDAVSGRSIGEIKTSAGDCGIAVSADGSRVYINNGNAIAVVNAWTNRIVASIPTSSPATAMLALSPDKAYLYVVCNAGLSIISLYGDNGDEVAFIDGVSAISIAVSPDGKYVYTTNWGNCELQVVDIGQRRIAATIDLVPADYSHATMLWEGAPIKKAGQAEDIAVSPDGRRAVVAIWASGYIAVVDLQAWSLEKAVRLDRSSFQGVAYSPDGEYVYVADYDGGKILVLDGTTFSLVRSFNVAPRPRNIAIDRDGKYICVAHDHGPTEIVQLPGGNLVNVLGVTASKEGSNIAFNPEISGGYNSIFTEPRAYICRNDTDSVSVYNASTGLYQCQISVTHIASGITVSRDGNYVYISDRSEIAVADARKNSFVNRIPTSHPTTGYLITSPDDRYLYAVCDKGLSIIELAPTSGREIGFVDGVTAMGIGISPDGKYVYTTDWGNCLLQVINTREQRIEKLIDLIPASAYHGTVPWKGAQVKAAGQAVGLAVSPDGLHAVVGIWAGSFAPVVDLQSKTLENSVSLDGRSYQCAAFSPDGKRIYLSHYDGNRIIVLDGTNYTPIGTIATAAHPKNIAITPDGKYLYVAHQQANVEVISLPDGTRLRTLNIKASESGQNIAFNQAAYP